MYAEDAALNCTPREERSKAINDIYAGSMHAKTHLYAITNEMWNTQLNYRTVKYSTPRTMNNKCHFWNKL